MAYFGKEILYPNNKRKNSMINSPIFDNDNLKYIQDKLLLLLNSCQDFDNARIINSPRAVGDTVQEILGEKMNECFPDYLIKDFNDSFARRAMADVAFMDLKNNYFIVDIKTHNRNTDFNMPNLTSVERLSRFYEDDKNFFVILLAEYKISNGKIEFDAVRLLPIEHLKWNCLTIGALGWGQIQIANARIVNIDRTQNRKNWMLQLCDIMDIFYPKEIAKIEKRINYFAKVRAFWENK